MTGAWIKPERIVWDFERLEKSTKELGVFSFTIIFDRWQSRSQMICGYIITAWERKFLLKQCLAEYDKLTGRQSRCPLYTVFQYLVRRAVIRRLLNGIRSALNYCIVHCIWLLSKYVFMPKYVYEVKILKGTYQSTYGHRKDVSDLWHKRRSFLFGFQDHFTLCLHLKFQ